MISISCRSCYHSITWPIPKGIDVKFQNECGIRSTSIGGPAQLYITVFGPMGQAKSPQQTTLKKC